MTQRAASSRYSSDDSLIGLNYLEREEMVNQLKAAKACLHLSICENNVIP